MESVIHTNLFVICLKYCVSCRPLLYATRIKRSIGQCPLLSQRPCVHSQHCVWSQHSFSVGSDSCFLRLIVSIPKQDAEWGFFAALHFLVLTLAKYTLMSKTDVRTPSGMACIQSSMRPTYISYLLEQTDSGGEIANWTRCPNKCLHVVRGQSSWATKPIHIAH